MLKRIMVFFLCFALLFSIQLPVSATEANNDVEYSTVTFKANLSDKVAAYYSYVMVAILSDGASDEQQYYSYKLYDYNNFTCRTSLPNGTYTIISGGIPNDVDQEPVKAQTFTVGSSPHIVVEFDVVKDMSAYPDITTTSQSTEVASGTLTESTQYHEDSDEPTTSSVLQEGTSSSINDGNATDDSDSIKGTVISFLASLIFIALIAAGIIYIIRRKQSSDE